MLTAQDADVWWSVQRSIQAFFSCPQSGKIWSLIPSAQATTRAKSKVTGKNQSRPDLDPTIWSTCLSGKSRHFLTENALLKWLCVASFLFHLTKKVLFPYSEFTLEWCTLSYGFVLFRGKINRILDLCEHSPGPREKGVLCLASDLDRSESVFSWPFILVITC